MKGVFFTGTDTGVGKTMVSAVFAAYLRGKNINAGVMKPVASGGVKKKGRFVSEDALILKKAASSDDPIELINPVCFRKPLAPYPASLIEKKEVDLNAVYSSYKKLCEKHEFMVVEGIGGVFVPVRKNYFIIDLIKYFKLPVVIVCRPGLGTINHTLLTVKALQANKIKILCLVLNSASPDEDISGKTNPRVIEELTGLEVINFPFSKINFHKTLTKSVFKGKIRYKKKGKNAH